MARYTDAKCKLCRRAQEKLFLKGDRCNSPKCAIVRKAYPPGMHGTSKKKGRGQSEYGKQLAMKQKVKRIYGIYERQFRKHFEDISGKSGVTGDLFLARLELRLDNIVYRIGFAPSRSNSRQIVSHGAVTVNGKKVDIPSYEVKQGDVIGIKTAKLGNNFFKNQWQYLKNKKDFPAWIQFDAEKMEGKIIAKPDRQSIGIAIDAQMVVEYYSR